MTRKARLIFTALIIICSLVVVTASAQAVSMNSEQQKVDLNYSQPEKAETPNVFWMVIQLILALGLIVLLAWGLIQLFGNRANNKLQGRWIRVVDEIMLGQNRGIIAMETGGRVFLVGVTDHQISMLLELDDNQLVQDMLAAGYENNQTANPGLEAIIKQIKDRIPGAKSEKSEQFHSVMDDKLKSLERMNHRLRNINDIGEKNDKD
ncbi:MAG: FliO/MopB family protein [Ignavibacteriales bacterium]